MNDANKYAQNWHFLPDANPALDEKTFSVRTNFPNNSNIKTIPVEIDNLEFIGFPGLDKLNAPPIITSMLGPVNEEETVIKRGMYSPGSGNLFDSQHASYVRRITGKATFSAVLYPHERDSDCNLTVTPIKLDAPQGTAAAFELGIESAKDKVRKKATYYIVNGKSPEITTAEVNDYTVSAMLMYLEKDMDNRPVRLMAERVTEIKDKKTGIAILSSAVELPELSVTWNGNTLEIHTSYDGAEFYGQSAGWNKPAKREMLDLSTLVIHSPTTITGAAINGRPIPVTFAKGYARFGKSTSNSKN